jgi:hypothetical protein
MKVTKTASGKSTVKLSQSDWANFGKKAGWLDENGELKVQAEEIEVEADIEREAAGVETAPAPVKTPTKTPTPDKKPGKKRIVREEPDDVGAPAKGEGEEDIAASTEEGTVEASVEEVSATNLPTIASELAKLKKK